jgi:hypothetical protein
MQEATDSFFYHKRMIPPAELGTRFFLRFALALSRSLAELFALALSRSFLSLKFRAFAFALPRSLIFRALFLRC